MSSPTVIDCRGMQLLKLDGIPHEESFVSVHQLSLYLWELFKVPRGSVQKKISDLGFIIYSCTKEGVQLLREQSVISAYKASQVTLSDAERVFDAIQLSRRRREISERRKQEHADRRWLQKVGNKRLDVVDGRGDTLGQVGKKGTEQNGIEKCALYGESSPPTTVALGNKVKDPSMNEDNRGSLECKDEMTKGKVQKIVLKRTINSNGHSQWIGKKTPTVNGHKKIKKHPIESSETFDAENSVHCKKSKRNSSTSEQQVLATSLSNGVESSGLNTISNGDFFQDTIFDEENKGNFGKCEVFDLDHEEDSQIAGLLDSKNDKPSTALNNKRIVKLRVFAQNSSPKVRRPVSKPPSSGGKHFPSTSNKSPKTSHKPLLVSISRSLLTEGCNKEFSSSGKCFSSERAPSTTTLVCSPSTIAGQKRPRKLSNFASKKRASTRTPPPLGYRLVKHRRLPLRSSLSGSISPISPPASPFLVQSGAEVNIPSKYSLTRSCKSHKSTVSSSSSSPQPRNSLSVLENQPGLDASDDPVTSHASLDNSRGSQLVNTRDNSLDAVALSEVKDLSATVSPGVSAGPKSQVLPYSEDEEGFSFRKHFGSIPCKLVVHNGELCPAVSLSLKGVKTSDIPPDHPIWTWKVGQSTKKVAPVFKWRTTRQKNTKSKLQ